jgi:hypothetical protein
MKLPTNRTPAEEQLLAELLVAVRKAVRTGHQLSITVDPWVAGDGVHASIMFDPSGYQVTIPGRFRARRARPKPGTCRVCGCTDEAACATEAGPCSWANLDHTLCSGCLP